MNYFSTDEYGLKYYTAGNLQSADGFVHQRRTLDCEVFIFVLEGTLFITQNDEEFSVGKGQYILLHSGFEHFGHKASSGRLSYLWVHFVSETEFSPISSPDSSSHFHSPAYLIPEYNTSKSPQRTGMLFRQLIDFSRQKNLYTEKILNYALSLLLMEITQQLIDSLDSTAPSVSPIIYEVREWIKSNCHSHSLCAGVICNHFHYNREYLSTLFKKQLGCTITEYLNSSRIDVAKNLLASNDITIKETAYSSGFNDEKYFMKLFRRHEGMTPLQYKNAFCKH